MSDVVYCPHCKGDLANSPDLEGQVVACPLCGGQFQIPAPMRKSPLSASPPPIRTSPRANRHPVSQNDDSRRNPDTTGSRRDTPGRSTSPSGAFAVQCPHCGRSLQSAPTAFGRLVACPSCHGQFNISSPVELPPRSPVPPVSQSGGRYLTPPPVQTSPELPRADHSATSATSRHKKLPDDTGRTTIITALICAVAGAVGSVPFAVATSQYWPLFGGFFGAIAQPWSPARIHFMINHIVAFAIFGAIIGAIIGFIVRALKRK
jgi:nitrite reductase/ring-hydroxylating ferredoxin subunit